jgi:hypothetical protein
MTKLFFVCSVLPMVTSQIIERNPVALHGLLQGFADIIL